MWRFQNPPPCGYTLHAKELTLLPVDFGTDCTENTVPVAAQFLSRKDATKDRPGLTSERASHRDRTTNSRPKLLKRKKYLVEHPQSALDTKTY
jgi:hypothetical protein